MDSVKLDRTFNDQKQVESSVFEDNIKTALDVDKLFLFLNTHFKEFHQEENLREMLKFVERCVKFWISQDDLEVDIGIPLRNMLLEHNGDDDDMNIVFQIFYQMMHSIKTSACFNITISGELVRNIIATIPKIKKRTSASNGVACIQKYMETFPKETKILEELWCTLKYQLQNNIIANEENEIQIDMLIQLIDGFKSLGVKLGEEKILTNTIERLLKSEQKKTRKRGVYLLKKVSEYVVEHINITSKMWLSSNPIENISESWVLYITMLENVEEEQSHLILPSLENLDELIGRKHLSIDWLNILYARLLTHNNNLVTRRCIELILKTYTCSDLCEEILKHLLKATNSNLLFNCEGYFLKDEYIISFLKGDTRCLLRLVSEIENWKSIPLYIWLKNLSKLHIQPLITLEHILKLSSCVRKLQNCLIRGKAIELCQEWFEDYKQKMSIREYVKYIETLYNSSDKYQEHGVLYLKKSSLLGSDLSEPIFMQRFYEIFTNYEWDNSELISFLRDVPVKQHGWLRFAPFKLQLTECDRINISNLYKMHFNVRLSSDIDIVINCFKNCLMGKGFAPYDKSELIECNQAAISFYIYQRYNFDCEEMDTSRFILDTGINNNAVLLNFTQKLLHPNQIPIDLCLVDKLLEYKSKEIREHVSQYLCRSYGGKIIEKYISSITISKSFQVYLFRDINTAKVLIYDWLKVKASKGDKRIEEGFCFHHFDHENFDMELDFLSGIAPPNCNEIILDLLKYHADITKKKPRYFENSNEHRIKLRIAYCVYYLTISSEEVCTNILDQIWNIVINENNQLNITYIYECILWVKEVRGVKLLDKLEQAKDMAKGKQISIIWIVHNYFHSILLNKEEKLRVLKNLFSLTIGANFQIRLHAQMCLYKFLNKHFPDSDNNEVIIKCLKDAMMEVPEYTDDIRFHMYDLSKKIPIIFIIFYVTNVPFDELHYLGTKFYSFNDVNIHTELKSEIDQIESCRKMYLKKFKAEHDDLGCTKGTINDQIQRKMHPVGDFIQQHNLLAYSIEENPAELFIVASLVDKLANLGGIARTCEVLGVRNLALDCKAHTKNPDFKNLSMTAERNLNIHEVKQKDLKEFLIKKKLDGYTIIGAEQTCNSQRFHNFKFPQKCVLLLGHEKEGIPAPLLSLLDDVVEIPQCGQVRSLNVHVTGALFMWEYCKQHLLHK